MNPKIRWGILGPGRIAHKFVQGLLTLEDGEVVAAGSRDLSRAEEFTREYGIPRAYGSYEALAEDPDIDVIYVATPHPHHREGALLCLEAGKAVLLEKPMTLNSRDTRAVVEKAREKKVFLMEAMWTRFMPAIVKVREWLSQGLIGEVECVKADFGFPGDADPKGRLLNPVLGGGGLLDVGIYPVSFASMIFGCQPDDIKSMARIGDTGVDEFCSILFGYGKRQFASLNASIRTQLNNDAWIFGSKGYIHIPAYFHQAKSADLYLKDGTEIIFGPDFESTGYQYEAQEVMECIRNGKLESDIMPLDETVAIMETMDAIRSQWNLVYPDEQQ